MKQIALATFVAACLINTNAISQNLQLEVIGGPALTSVRGSETYKSMYKSTINLTAGIGLAYRLTENSYINTKVLYERKGGKLDFTLRDANNQSTGDGSTRAAFDYITIPVQWRYETGNKIRFQAGAGIYGAYLLQQSYITRAKNLPEADNTMVATDYYQRFDFGASVSATTYIPLNESLKLAIGVNDNFGLINADKKTSTDIKHNSLSLTTGISIGF